MRFHLRPACWGALSALIVVAGCARQEEVEDFRRLQSSCVSNCQLLRSAMDQFKGQRGDYPETLAELKESYPLVEIECPMSRIPYILIGFPQGSNPSTIVLHDPIPHRSPIDGVLYWNIHDRFGVTTPISDSEFAQRLRQLTR